MDSCIKDPKSKTYIAIWPFCNQRGSQLVWPASSQPAAWILVKAAGPTWRGTSNHGWPTWREWLAGDVQWCKPRRLTSVSTTPEEEAATGVGLLIKGNFYKVALGFVLGKKQFFSKVSYGGLPIWLGFWLFFLEAKLGWKPNQRER